jgi:Putative binding domain, N-terminal
MRSRLGVLSSTSLLTLAWLAAACSSTQTSVSAPSDDKCQVSASSSPSSFTATGGPGSLTVTTARDCTWSVSTQATWISILGDRGGQGEATVSYSVAPNGVPSARSATLLVASQSLTLSQAAAPCQFSLSRSGDAIGYAGGRLSVDVNTLTGCSWSASSGDSWIAVTSGQTGNASASVGLTVAANSGAARVGHVIAGGQTYSVSQDAMPPSAPAPTPTPTPTPTPPPPAPKTVDFGGLVLNLSGNCPNIRFNAGFATVVADNSTEFKKTKCGDIRNGRVVSGTGIVQSNGVIKATEIVSDKKDDGQ